MKSYHWNGEYWFKRDWSLLKRFRHWFIWIGGWEKANSTGWHFRYNNGRWRDPFPISLFGHRVTFQSYGFHAKTKQGYLVYSKARCDGKRLYISPDGTPSKAHTWFWGTPQSVRDYSRQPGEPIDDYNKRLSTIISLQSEL